MNDADDSARPRLGVAMMVRNEQDVLAESLATVRGIADKIVVLDTGSTDDTVAIARKAGATVFHRPWDDNFSAARNHLLALVDCDWVLWLDACEQIAADDAAKLREHVENRADPATAYLLPVVIPPPTPGASAEQVYQLRLLPCGAGLCYEGRVAETVRPSVERAGLRMELAPGRITCHPRRHEAARKTRVAQRNLALVAREADERENPPARLLLAAGAAASDLGQDEPAREAFRAAIEVAEPGSTEMLEAYYGLLTTFDSESDRRDDQVDICLEALELFPVDAQLLLAMGNYMQGQGRSELAVRSFRAAVELGQVQIEAWHLTELVEVAACCLALSLQAEHRNDEARRVLEEALAASPGSQRLMQQTADFQQRQAAAAPSSGEPIWRHRIDTASGSEIAAPVFEVISQVSSTDSFAGSGG